MIDFRQDERMSTTELQREVRLVVEQLNGTGLFTVLSGINVATTETPISHGLQAPPRAVFVTPHGAASVYRSKPADHKFVYLRASAATTADLLVIA